MNKDKKFAEIINDPETKFIPVTKKNILIWKNTVRFSGGVVLTKLELMRGFIDTGECPFSCCKGNKKAFEKCFEVSFHELFIYLRHVNDDKLKEGFYINNINLEGLSDSEMMDLIQEQIFMNQYPHCIFEDIVEHLKKRDTKHFSRRLVRITKRILRRKDRNL